ncbi:MutT/NUDIX family protein [Marinobacterium lacunae]|uniref:MutT/NUDIX family protein n=1 Tax=Marinobacterium lacunae TaxID=1232683 RepID=A0A081FUM3_9GAMM|nr:NUDIX domain-containing protein [Marinobacterium lacunae]KEA62228.1 MutT/NUDIX family protein [Marinobacterium lacunae]MBR9883437.1 NUDIX domain-containing protein [Oceanospirillales bacterium]
MNDLIPQIRNAVRALIVKDRHVLLLKKDGYSCGGVRYALPGGGQDAGEALTETLQRECMEEIDTEVEIGDLIAVADFLKQRESEPSTRRHVMEFLFLCSVDNDYTPRNGSHPDKHQMDVVWMPIEKIGELQLFPQYLAECIPQFDAPNRQAYLGLFHDNGFKD